MKPQGALEHEHSADFSSLWFCRAMDLVAREAEKIGASWLESSGELVVSPSTNDYSEEPSMIAKAHKLNLRIDDAFKCDEWALFMQLGSKEIIFWSPGA